MKRAIFTSFMLAAAFLLLESFGGNPQTPQGSPGGYTGSPADGMNCTSCHGGSAAQVTGWITSNVPASGYVPGTAYTITVTVSGSGAKGFEISPQTQTGALVGTLTAGSGTHLVNGNKAVTHTASSTANPKTWTFTWTAPVAGTGAVTFYGAMIVSKPNTKLSTLVIQEATGVGMQELSLNTVQMFPNPCHEVMNISGLTKKSEINLYGMDGRFIGNLFDGMPAASEKLMMPSGLGKGIYLLEIKSGNERKVEKILVN